MRSRLAGHRWPIVSLSLLLAAACADPPTAPIVVRDAAVHQAMAEGDSVRSMFIPNSRRYRDRGAQPSTGRAGNAALAVQALAGKDARADIYVASHAGDGAWMPDVTLNEVQIKGFAPDGRHLFTRNATGLRGEDTLQLIAALPAGSGVQVQAVIGGADPRRVGVVTVNDVVRRLPDLAIEEVTIPIRAAIHTAPTLRAVVRELNGDVGGVTDCVLEIDGSEVDRVWGMWVDAGGTVTCQFFYVFRALGNRDVRIRLEPQMIRDWDMENHVASGTIRIDPISSTFYFDASFQDHTFDERSRGTWRWAALDDSWGYEQDYEYARSGRTQDAWMTAFMPHAVTFPLERIQVRQYTRDQSVQGFVLVDVPADFTWEFEHISQSCIYRTFIPELGGRGRLEICSVRAAATEWEPAWELTGATYYRNAGDVTYHSRGWARQWNRHLGYDDVYSWNDAFTDTYGSFPTYGFEYAFFLSLVDRGALYRANPFVWLAESDNEWSQPWQCWTYADEWSSSEQCSEYSRTDRVVGGSVYGEPWSP